MGAGLGHVLGSLFPVIIHSVEFPIPDVVKQAKTSALLYVHLLHHQQVAVHIVSLWIAGACCPKQLLHVRPQFVTSN